MNSRQTKDKGFKLQGIKWIEIFLCLLAFMFARIGIENYFYTAGVAYVGSLFFSKSIRRWSWLFATLGIISLVSFQIETVKYIFMFAFIQLLREMMVRMNKDLNNRNQMVIVGGVVLIVDGIAGAIHGINIYTVGASLFEAMVAMGLVYVFSYGVKVIRMQRRTPLTRKEAVSMILMFACVLGGLVDFYIKMPLFKEVYFRDIITFIVLIGITYLGGISNGVTMSMVVSGLLVAVNYMEPHFVAVYGMVAIMGGLFLPLGRWGVIVGCGIGQVLGFILFNDQALDYSLVGAYAIAAIISFIIPKSYFGVAHWFAEKSIEENEQVHLTRVQYIITQRLKHIVNGFEKLGIGFKNEQARKIDYTPKDIQLIIEETGEKVCKECSMRHYCWEQDLEKTYQYTYSMIETIRQKGRITVGDIPNKFKEHCINAQSYAYLLSCRMDLVKQDIMWQNRFLENRSLVAEELCAVAETLKGVIKEVDKELYFNKEEERVLKEMLIGAGIRVKDIMVLENKGKTTMIDIYTTYCNKQVSIIEVMQGIIKEALTYTVCLEQHECGTNGCHYKFSIRNSYRVTAGSAICAKQGVCGDVHSFMELEDNQYLLALADGMGSGSAANEESTAAIEMLEDFMGSGFRNDLAVKMINAALILKSTEEIFSTIDITLIDERTGVAEFLKAGAATSFILRNDQVMTVQTSSLPVGIVREVDIEIKKEQLRDHDMIIMVTDGMLQTKQDALGKEETFKHFIKEANTRNPQYMADYLMEKSMALLGVDERDDMTIVVAKIWKEH